MNIDNIPNRFLFMVVYSDVFSIFFRHMYGWEIVKLWAFNKYPYILNCIAVKGRVVKKN